ncbi:MAG: response regulator transcription factor [Chitinispirillaceae bacterium]
MPNDVLVIEDEKALAELVRINLSLRGVSVITAGTGEEGLELAYSEHPRLILLDVRLPDLDGWEICRELKKKTTDHWMPAIVFLTAATQKTDREKAKEAGGDGFLEKPFEITDLVGTVKQFLQK